jgi:hypothetical protein
MTGNWLAPRTVDRETLVAARYDIITAGENWVTVVASGVAALRGLLRNKNLEEPERNRKAQFRFVDSEAVNLRAPGSLRIVRGTSGSRACRQKHEPPRPTPEKIS